VRNCEFLNHGGMPADRLTQLHKQLQKRRPTMPREGNRSRFRCLLSHDPHYLPGQWISRFPDAIEFERRQGFLVSS